MKKLLWLMIIGIMAFSLTACGDSASENSASQEAGDILTQAMLTIMVAVQTEDQVEDIFAKQLKNPGTDYVDYLL